MARMLLILSLGGLLVVALVWAGWVWMRLGDAELSTNGIVAMVLGIVFSIVVGGGLMALVFYSAREGYDDQVRYDDPDERP